MPQPENPFAHFFHSQARRRSESAAIPIHDRDVKRDTATSSTARNPFAPPVPPKDEPHKTSSTSSAISETRKTLSALEKEWMLNDCIQPTLAREDKLRQEYSPKSMRAVDGSEIREGRSPASRIHPALRSVSSPPRSFIAHRESVQDSGVDVFSPVTSSDVTSEDANSEVKSKAAKRDTVADLFSEIMGTGKAPRLPRQRVLDEVSTRSAVPPPLRIPSKPKPSPRGSALPPTHKYNKLELGGRPSLQIVTTFAEPRTAPEPLANRRSYTKRMSHGHGRKDRPARASMMRRSLFSKDAQVPQVPELPQVPEPRNDIPIPPIPRKSSKRGRSITLEEPLLPKKVQLPLEESVPPPLTKQRRAQTFPAQKSSHKLRKDSDIRLSPTLPQRRATHHITVNRMRDPDEAFEELIALRRRATADVSESAPTVPAGTNSKPHGSGGGSGGDCFGLYTTAKGRVDDIVEVVRSVREKNRARKKREKMMAEVRRKYEEMASASTHQTGGEGGYKWL
ncbi:uncharacterized protein J4E78_010873 [Alternaria triticimaculans]|uniref:uncharacterized protein n=1 Tax=Alternaria triticimaculans TaxID=297637 RepID=UPI0020C3D31E|nr:uncharacterized protein J4E78_010873 [Alternaria triticimaculans]KAI4639546.1 hypothetical protein J4E78_010873 [Alternaria triticimaculans]